MRHVLRYCALALCAALAVFEPVVMRVAALSHKVFSTCDDLRTKLVKFTADTAAGFRARSSEAARANGLTVESHGFRLTALLKALPFEVGWSGTKTLHY